MDEANYALVTLGLLPSFTMSVKEFAEWVGLELTRIVVDGIKP